MFIPTGNVVTFSPHTNVYLTEHFMCGIEIGKSGAEDALPTDRVLIMQGMEPEFCFYIVDEGDGTMAEMISVDHPRFEKIMKWRRTEKQERRTMCLDAMEMHPEERLFTNDLVGILIEREKNKRGQTDPSCQTVKGEEDHED